MTDIQKKLSRRRFLKNGVRFGVLALGTKGFYNTTSYNVKKEKVQITIEGLPKGFKGLKIAFLSDFHSSPIVSEKLLSEAARLASTEKPDMVLLGGDYISGETKFLSGSIGGFKEKYLKRLIHSLSILKAPMGIYAVMGNHDHWSGKKAMKIMTEAMEKELGVSFLRNKHVTLKKGSDELELIGIDDYWSGGSVAPLIKKLKKDNPRILLSHNPDVNEEVEVLKERVELIISGHTHGGQVRVPFLGAPYLPSKFGSKYSMGLVRDGKRQTYVSRGIGNLLIPVRLGSPPEVSIITLL